MQRKAVGYTLLFLGIISLIIWLINLYIQPFLGEGFKKNLYSYIFIVLAVAGFFSVFNDTIDLYGRLWNKPDPKHDLTPTPGSTNIKKMTGGIVISGGTNVTVNLPPAEEKPLIIDKNQAIEILRAINKTEYVKNVSLDGYLAREHKYPIEKRQQIIEDLEEHGLIEIKSNITRITGKGKEYIH